MGNSATFGSELIENEHKGTSSSIHTKRKTNSTSQTNETPWSPTHEVLASCRTAFVVWCVHS